MSYSIETPQSLLVQSLQERWGSLKDKPELSLKELEKTLSQASEELTELQDIIDKVKTQSGVVHPEDIKDFRDLVVDMMFYLLQPVACSGLSSKLQKDFFQIYLNNATKVCETLKLAEETRNSYIKDGVDCYIQYVESFDHYVVKRRSDDKVLKPNGFQPVELED